MLTLDEEAQTLLVGLDEVALEAEECRQSFRSFVQQAWAIIEPFTPLKWNWHHDAIVEHLEAASRGEIPRLIVNVPPGSMKSILVSTMWPVWDWIDSPWRRFMSASYILDLAGRDSQRSRDLIQSDWYQARWGDRFRLVSDKNIKTNYENDKRGWRKAVSVMKGTGYRANVRILDDPHNIQEAESDTVREGVVNWARQTWSERGADPDTDIQVVVMQRVHQRDVCGYYLDEDELWRQDAVHLKIPMRFNPKKRCVTSLGFRDPRQQDRELLFPAMWDEGTTRHKESTLGEYGVAAQHQQEPAPPGGGILKDFWWRFWHFPDMENLPEIPQTLPDGEVRMVKSVPLPYSFDIEVQAWDMSFKNLDTSDPVCGLHMAKRGPDTFVRDHRWHRWTFTESQKQVKDFREQYPRASASLVEEAANGPAIIDSLRASVPGMIPMPTAGGKEARAQAAAPVLEGGNMYLPHPAMPGFEWVRPFIEELGLFNKGTHDDQVDAWSHGVKYLYGDAEQGIQITTEYNPRYHRFEHPQTPVPGLESFRFWHIDYWMCCIVGQVTPQGRILILDCILDANISLDELIDWRLQPILSRRYRGCSQWRDVWNRPLPTANSPQSEHNLLAVVGEKLQGAVELGEPKFENRVEAIKAVLQQVERFRLDPEQAQPVHDALNGRYMYPVGPDGLPRRDGCLRKHPGSAVGEALGHGLARLFVRKPPAPIIPKKTLQKRAQSYAVD